MIKLQKKDILNKKENEVRTMDIIWGIAYYLLIIWVAITIGLVIRRLLDNMKQRTKSRIELEALQKKELEKRIEILEQQLAEKDNKL